MNVLEPPIRTTVVDAGAFSLPYDHCLCTALTDAGVEVTLARSPSSPGPWDTGSYSTWDKFHRRSRSKPEAGNRHLRRALKGIDHLLSMRRFEVAVAAARPDVIHFQWLPLPAVDLLSLRRLRRWAPLVLTMHDTTLFHGSPSSLLQGLGLRRAVRQFDHLVVHTAFSRDQLLAGGWTTADRVSVIRHGILGYYRDRVGASAPHAGARTMILFFGSLKPYKGLDTLIRAVAHLSVEDIGRSRVRIAGQPGMDLGPLRAMASELGVAETIEWETGFIPEQRVAELFQEADVVVLPYLEIDQSGVLLTAAGFGKAVVATSVGGIPEVIRDGESGLLTPPGDAQGLARALGRAIADRGLRTRMGATLRDTAQKEHSWPAAAAATRALYSSLVVARRKSSP